MVFSLHTMVSMTARLTNILVSDMFFILYVGGSPCFVQQRVFAQMLELLSRVGLQKFFREAGNSSRHVLDS
jgi:hypothetical protein